MITDFYSATHMQSAAATELVVIPQDKKSFCPPTLTGSSLRKVSHVEGLNTGLGNNMDRARATQHKAVLFKINKILLFIAVLINLTIVVFLEL